MSSKHLDPLRDVKNPIPQIAYDRAKELHELVKNAPPAWDAKITLG